MIFRFMGSFTFSLCLCRSKLFVIIILRRHSSAFFSPASFIYNYWEYKKINLRTFSVSLPILGKETSLDLFKPAQNTKERENSNEEDKLKEINKIS